MFEKVFDLRTLNGTNGFIVSENKLKSLGYSVSTGGDVNGDGVEDIIMLGDQGNSSYIQRTVYIIFGQKNFSAEFNLSTLNGHNGFVVLGGSQDDTLSSLASTPGDVNADGIDDVILGAFTANNGRGAVYIIFGQKNFPAEFNLTTLDGENGFVVFGIKPMDYLGAVVSITGDINHDGLDDIVLAATRVNDSQGGAVYIIFGQKTFPAEFNLTTLDGENGFMILGLNTSYYLPNAAGDLNGDGIDDIALGAPVYNNYAGIVCILFGQKRFPAQFNVTSLNGANGFIVFGLPERSSLGAVNAAGDMNGDGIDDVVFGANNFYHAGAAYIVFGQKSFSAQFNLESLNGTNGFMIPGNVDQGAFGRLVRSTGDINGDTKADIVITGMFNSIQRAAYVIFGNISFPAKFALSTLNGVNGFVVPGLNKSDGFATSINTAGDVNCDGIDDLIVGAPYANNQGAVYVIFGKNSVPPNLQNNYFLALQGKAVPLTTANINASDIHTSDADLFIIASNVQHGQFEYVNQPQVPITNFTQQNISTSAVQFRTDNSYISPAYDISVKNKYNNMVGPYPATISFHDAPRLINNQLIIQEGKHVVLTSGNIQAEENYTPKGDLIFNISNIQHGKFEMMQDDLKSNSFITVTEFFQQNVTDGKVQFVHDGSKVAPSYAVSVSDGQLSSGNPENAKIDFNIDPSMDNTLPIALGTAAAITAASAMGIVGFFAYKKYQRTKEIEQQENSMLGTPVANNPSINESEVLLQIKTENKKSSWGCQLF